MPSERSFKIANRAHQALLSISGGRIGSQGKGMPLIELTTTGRRSGRPHSVMLAAPIHSADHYVLVGSRGGSDVHPAWFHNLRDHPKVDVTYRKQRRAMVARVAGPDERAELWATITAEYPHFGGYQDKTEREIPLVVVEAV